MRRYCWLVPAIIELNAKQQVTRKELAQILEVSQKLARTILWMLSRLGLVEKSPRTGEYLVSNSLREIAKTLRTSLVGIRRYRNTTRMVLEHEDMYYIVVIRRNRIISRRVSKEIVNKVEELLRRKSMSIDEISRTVSASIREICDSLRVLEIRGVLKRVKDGGSGKSIYLVGDL